MPNSAILNYSQLKFVLIGPSKTASYWLSKCLQAHTDIFLPSETNFLTHYYDHGWDYWQKFYSASNNKSCVGEYANWYFSFSGIPKKLYELNPGIKIIVNVRNPVSRAVSFYKHDLGWGHIGKHIQLRHAVKEDFFYERYIGTGRYSVHLRRFLEYFSPEQIFLFPSPTSTLNKEEKLKALFEFLNLKYSDECCIKAVMNKSLQPLFPSVHRNAYFGKNKITRSLSLLFEPFNRVMGKILVPDPVRPEDVGTVNELFKQCKEEIEFEKLIKQNSFSGYLKDCLDNIKMH